MNTTVTSKQKWLKKFHTLCTRAGIGNEEKYAIVGSFGHDSSRDMTIPELAAACDMLNKMLNPGLADADHWRKRVMAAIGGWLRGMSIEQSPDKIKAIACRAAGYEKFNEIPRERLINLYYAWLKKQKDFKAVDGIAKEEVEKLTFLN